MHSHYYAIYDRKAEVFGDLMVFFSPEPAAAKRWFYDMVMDKNPNNYLGRYPDDFDLYYLGKFDKQLGQFVVGEDEDGRCGCLSKAFVCNAGTFFKEISEEDSGNPSA